MRPVVAYLVCAAAQDQWFQTALQSFQASAKSPKELVSDLKSWQRHESDPVVFQKIGAKLTELTRPSTTGAASAPAPESLEDRALEEALGGPVRAAPPAPPAPEPARAPAPAVSALHVGKHIQDMWGWKPVSVAADDAAAKSALSAVAPALGGAAAAEASPLAGLESELAHDGADLDAADTPVPAPPRRLRAAPEPVAPAAPPAKPSAYSDFFAPSPAPPAKPSTYSDFLNSPSPAPPAPVYEPPPAAPAAPPAPQPRRVYETPAAARAAVPADERKLLHPAPKRDDQVEAEQEKIRKQIQADQATLAAPVQEPVSVPHGPVDGKLDTDPELAAVQQENPMAYGMVKALLLKKSMGLIKSRHDDDEPAEPEHHGPVDMFSWKPHDSAADLVDETADTPALSLTASASSVSTADAPAAPKPSVGLAAYLGVKKQQVRSWDIDPPAPSPPPPVEAPVEVSAPAAAPPMPVVQAAPAPAPKPSMWDWQPSESATDLIAVDPDNKGNARVQRASVTADVQSAPAVLNQAYKSRVAAATQAGVQSASSVLNQFMNDLD